MADHDRFTTSICGVQVFQRVPVVCWVQSTLAAIILKFAFIELERMDLIDHDVLTLPDLRVPFRA